MSQSKGNLAADLAYQKAILGSVSRTFALTIPLLPPTLEKAVGNTYLLCRIIDTVEDATELSAETKNALSNHFLQVVLGHASVETFVTPCLAALKNYSNLDELDLIKHTPNILNILHTCDTTQQAAVGQCISIMSEGMSTFHAKQSQHGLENLREFEEYCYVVAGVVGEMLTTIFSHHSPHFASNIRGKEYLAISFGQALQMTNILKDASQDGLRNVSWLPYRMNQQELLKIAYQKLADACQYISLIPKSEVGIRRFCLLAFGLASMTLENIAKQDGHASPKDVKLNRSTVWAFYGLTKLIATNDYLIRQFFHRSTRSLKQSGVG